MKKEVMEALSEMDGSVIRLYLCLKSMSIDGVVVVNKSALSKQMGVPKSTIYNASVVLSKAGIIKLKKYQTYAIQ